MYFFNFTDIGFIILEPMAERMYAVAYPLSSCYLPLRYRRLRMLIFLVFAFAEPRHWAGH